MTQDRSEAAAEDFFHVQKDEQYQRLVRAEAEHWDKQPDPLLRTSPFPRLRSYENERLTGDPDRRWFEVISDYGPFRSGCVLGAGPGDVEAELLRRNGDLTLDVYDIAGEALASLEHTLRREFAGRVRVRQEDLNFAELRQEDFDLVVAQSCIHHIVNLEHLAFQVNLALTRQGYFFMCDTVAESYFQFAKEKKRLFETFLGSTRDSSGDPTTIEWPGREAWPYSPFESVRSEEILDVFGRYLQEERVTTCGALLQLTVFAAPGAIPVDSRLRRFVSRVRKLPVALRRRFLTSKIDLARAIASGDLLMELDRIVCDTGHLRPGLAFGIYRKRG